MSPNKRPATGMTKAPSAGKPRMPKNPKAPADMGKKLSQAGNTPPPIQQGKGGLLGKRPLRPGMKPKSVMP